MDKAIKKEAYTRAGKLTVDASEKVGHKGVPSTIHSISRVCENVKKNFANFSKNVRDFFLIGKIYRFIGDGAFEATARGVIRVKRFKRIVLCAVLALCIAGFAVSVWGVVQMFIGGAV